MARCFACSISLLLGSSIAVALPAPDAAREAAEAAQAQASELYTVGRVDDAIALLQHFVAEQQMKHGEHSREAIRARLVMSETLQHAGRLDDATYEAALAQRSVEKAALEKSPEMIAVLNRQGLLHDARGDYTSARESYQAAAEMCGQVFTEPCEETGITLSNLGLACLSLGELSLAEKYLSESLGELDRAHLGRSLAAAMAHNNLGNVYNALDRVDDEDREQLISFEIKKELFKGAPHRSMAIAWANRAGFLRRVGKVAEADEHAVEAIGLLKALGMQEHTDMAQVRMQRASILLDLPDFNAAYAELTEAERILTVVHGLGDEHPLVLQCRLDFGGYYVAAIAAGKGRQIHHDAAAKLNTLVFIHSNDRDQKTAALSNLALLADLQGKPEEAIQHNTQIIEGMRAIGPAGVGHLLTALNNRASVLMETGRYNDATEDLQEALGLMGETATLDRVKVLSHLALAEWGAEKKTKAAKDFTTALRDTETILWPALNKVTRSRQQLLSDQMHGVLWAGVSMAMQHTCQGCHAGKQLTIAFDVITFGQSEKRVIPEHSSLPTFERESLEWVLNSKHRIPEAMAMRQHLARQLADPETLEEVHRCRRKAAALRIAAVADPQQVRTLEQLESEEAGLYRSVGLMHTSPAREWISVEKLQRAIPEDSVLIECFAYVEVEPGKAEDKWGKPRYAVWIVPPAGQQEVALIPLGEMSTIATKVAAVHQTIRATPQLLSQASEAEVHERQRITMDELANVVWRPLAAYPAVQAARRIYISPDAALWGVPWGALRVGEQFLVEQKSIVLLGSGRDLLPVVMPEPRTNEVPTNAAYLVDRMRAHAAQRAAREVRPLLAIANPDCGAEPLPSTEREAGYFSAGLHLLRDQCVFSGCDATELRLRTDSPARVLYIGAHTSRVTPKSTDISTSESLTELLAEYAVRLASPNDDGDDGLITGLEVLDLDLHGTDLAFLAMCDSSVGERWTNEGASTLQHAFGMAGARHVVGTLWPLPARLGTEEIVGGFANTVGRPGVDYGDALADAQRSFITQCRSRRKPPHPYFWAAYTLMQATSISDEPASRVP